MSKLNIKKGDTAMVISGVSKGSKGKVIEVSPSEGQVIIEGVHMVSKHVKPKNAQQQGGIIKTEGPVRVSKVMVVCPKCGKPTRVGHDVADGKTVRVCKKCKATF